MRILLLFILILLLNARNQAQHQNIPVNYYVTQKIDRNILRGDGEEHTSIKPYVQTFVSSDLYQKEFEDTGLYYYDFTQKLFKESLLNIKQKDVTLVCDPLINLNSGRSYYQDSSLATLTNTRGVRVAGDITSKFSFETRFYETQLAYPFYLDSISDERDVVIGLGRDKPFKENGHDVGMSSGYISYSPVKSLNIQFGQGRHFIGNGYRSMLLSDNAFNYPYLSFQLSMLKGKLMYKNINAWMQTMERLPASSTPEALYKSKNGTFRYLSFKPGKRIEVGLFEGVIYNHYVDSVGEVASHPSFYVPIIGFASVANKNITKNKTVLGINMNMRLFQSVLVYGQLVMDDYVKYGYQIGAKWMDVAQIENSWIVVEYNNAAPYLYANTAENYIQNYAHGNQELAHPLGASFNEFIFMAHYERGHWFITGKYFGATKMRWGGSTYGENIFLPEDAILASVAPERVNWNYFGGELGFNLNVKTKLQLFGSAYVRNENVRNEWFWNIGIKTNLNNYYHDL